MKKTLKIVIACDKYKESLSALDVCNVIKKAIHDIDKNIEVIINPMADGGEGTVSTLVESLNGKYVETLVTGPAGEKVKAGFGLIKNKTAVIEMSSASGLWLLPNEKRNPLYTTTYGTGELIKKSIKAGARKIIIGIGGSATNDAGMGAAQALGVLFLDEKNRQLEPIGKELNRLEKVDTSKVEPLLKKTAIYVACDVENPLYGPDGAAYIYGPQKGAGQEDVKILDSGLRKFADVIKRDLKKDISRLKGAGAAGGLGAGLAAFFNAELIPGADIIIRETGLEEKIKDADLVITGEGLMDKQTFFGKSSYSVAKAAKKYNVPVITINGSIDIDRKKIDREKYLLYSGNFNIINKAMILEEIIKNTEKLLYFSAGEIIRFYLSIVSKYLKN